MNEYTAIFFGSCFGIDSDETVDVLGVGENVIGILLLLLFSVWVVREECLLLIVFVMRRERTSDVVSITANLRAIVELF